jgi:hypothetical protein
MCQHLAVQCIHMVKQNSVLQAAAPCSKYKDVSMLLEVWCGVVWRTAYHT